MQTVIREQVDALLRLGVIEASHAPIWSQVRIVPKPDGKWRFALDFIRLNAYTGALEVWPILNISYTLKRIGDNVWTDWLRCLDNVPISLKWSLCRQLITKREYLETCIDKYRLNNKTISDRWIKLFIKRCPWCQVRSRAHLAIRTHPFTCAA